MDEIMILAERLQSVADYLKSGGLTLEDIAYDDIIDIVNQFYYMTTKNESRYVDLYGTLLRKGLIHKDIEEVAAVLSMLAQHMCVLLNNGIRLYQAQCRIAHLLNCEKVRRWHEKNKTDTGIPFAGKGVVYSAITGDYDQVRDPQYVNPELDYILFTNNPKIISSVWDVRLIENPEQLDNVRLARRVKILGHEYLPGYDYSVWVDGKLEITGDLRKYVERYRNREPVLCCPHHKNDCIYQEKEECVIMGKDNPEIMEKQMQRYHREGYPPHNGLVDSAILIRELKEERTRQVMKTWWEEIIHGSRRDQLSFNYACWKNDFVYDTVDFYICENEYVKYHEHHCSE